MRAARTGGCGSDRTAAGQASHAPAFVQLVMLTMSIYGDENNRRSAGLISPLPLRVLRPEGRYPHSEQIRYSMEGAELRVPKSRAAMHKANRSDHEFSLGAAHIEPYLSETGRIQPSGGPDFLMSQISAVARSVGWRTPAVIILCGCLIPLPGFRPGSSFGFFLPPMSRANGWARDVFALAFAIQNLLWGIGQPFAGAVADRFGMVRVLTVGALLYAAGLALMAYTTSPIALQTTAGVLVGFGLSGCSFNLVIAAFGKLLPERYRMLAIGAGTAAGSFGQFLFAPFGVALIGGLGWQHALLVFSGMLLLIIPMAMALATPPSAPKPPPTRNR